MRDVKYNNDSYYHIYNRGVDKRNVFVDYYDFYRFFLSMLKFNNINSINGLFKKNNSVVLNKNLEIITISNSVSCSLVDIVCYCLNKNHYHFLLKQRVDNGISKFMHKLGMGYTHYFNKKYNRNGSLLQGAYKSVFVESTEQLLYLSSYITANAEIHGISKMENWRWSSYFDYFEYAGNTFCKKRIILNEFDSLKDYRDYVRIVIKDAKNRKNELK